VTKKRIQVKGLNDFIRELKRFYARGKGGELDEFVGAIVDIAERTMGLSCFLDLEGSKVLYEKELIEDRLYMQELEDVLVCEGDKLKLKLKLHHQVLVVDDYGNWIGMAPVKILDVNLLEVVRGGET